jgi:hypothetical protein
MCYRTKGSARDRAIVPWPRHIDDRRIHLYDAGPTKGAIMKPHRIDLPGTGRPAFDTLRPRWLPAPTLENWSWQLRGSCLGYPSEVFFPDGKQGQPLQHLEDRAKDICRDCPVLSMCRNYALSAPEMHGIWGAMTARERAKLLARIRGI